jgi:hypothetical protein
MAQMTLTQTMLKRRSMTSKLRFQYNSIVSNFLKEALELGWQYGQLTS